MRGFFEIGCYYPKTQENIGTLYRSANIMGGSGIFTIGNKYTQQHTDTMKTHRHTPLRYYRDFNTFLETLPVGCKLVGVELCEQAENLMEFQHPQQAVYLLGSEDTGLPDNVLKECDCVIKIPFDKNSLNVSVAGSIIMYDRNFKQKQLKYER